MFLSDRLIQIGRTSNPKNNLSMSQAVHQMNSECRCAVRDGEMPLRTQKAFALATQILNKEGYPFFKIEHFNL